MRKVCATRFIDGANPVSDAFNADAIFPLF